MNDVVVEESRYAELFDQHKPRLPDVISLQNQGPLNCVSTSLAMLCDIPADAVTEIFHDYYMDESTNPQEAIHDFLKETGFKFEWMPEHFIQGGVYLVTVGSLNLEGYCHQILIDYRDVYPVVIDPQRGKPGKRYYVWGSSTNENECFVWIKEGYYILDAVVYG